MARPSRYTHAIGDKIAERISEGENTEDADMPSKRSILRWARKNERFKPLYREAMADLGGGAEGIRTSDTVSRNALNYSATSFRLS